MYRSFLRRSWESSPETWKPLPGSWEFLGRILGNSCQDLGEPLPGSPQPPSLARRGPRCWPPMGPPPPSGYPGYDQSRYPAPGGPGGPG